MADSMRVAVSVGQFGGKYTSLIIHGAIFGLHCLPKRFYGNMFSLKALAASYIC